LSTAVDAVRRRLAEQHLASGVALADISQRLGYSEQSAFNRACVRWFGVSPGKLRPGEAQASTTTS
jgi:AraC-like DNA-binding protein